MTSAAADIAFKGRVSTIVDAVAREYQIEPTDVLGRDRHKCMAEARKVAFFLTRELTSLSYPELGRAFGRDHTTIITRVRKVKTDMVGDAHLFALVDRVRQAVLTEWAGSAA